VNKQAIAHFQGAFGQILVGTVNGIARLKRHNTFPTVRLKSGPCFRRGQVVFLMFHFAVRQHGQGSSEVNIACGHCVGHARVGRIVRPVYLLYEVLLVQPELFPQCEHRDRGAQVVLYDDFSADFEFIRNDVAHRKQVWNGPGNSGGQTHFIQYTMCVPFAHESGKRAENTFRNAVNIECGIGIHLYLGQFIYFLKQGGFCVFRDKTIYQSTAVGRYCHEYASFTAIYYSG